MDSKRRYTLETLAEETGESARRIRLLIQKGLIPKAEPAGHRRLYTDRHVERIRELQEAMDQLISEFWAQFYPEAEADDRDRNSSAHSENGAERERVADSLLERAAARRRGRRRL